VQGISLEPVSNWLEANIPGAVAPFTFELIAGGRSNLTFKVAGADGTQFVLRRPPLGHVLATAHDMAREHRIIAAVGRTEVPVPPALGVCTDNEVNGAPFYVMGYVDGVVLDSPERAEPAGPAPAPCRPASTSSTCWPRCTRSTSTRSASATSPSVRATWSGR
jgi:aminoglycoside phosphotransferase (APT) family kinase protein